jgi:hypothetical protein
VTKKQQQTPPTVAATTTPKISFSTHFDGEDGSPETNKTCAQKSSGRVEDIDGDEIDRRKEPAFQVIVLVSSKVHVALSVRGRNRR